MKTNRGNGLTQEVLFFISLIAVMYVGLLALRGVVPHSDVLGKRDTGNTVEEKPIVDKQEPVGDIRGNEREDEVSHHIEQLPPQSDSGIAGAVTEACGNLG